MSSADTNRKLASVRWIDEIRPIEGADAIECAVIGGWTVVVKRGEFAAGDLAVYLEIDSWVPTELAPFLSKGGEPREFNGVKGERLRTVKLRGQVSQGLLLPLHNDPSGTYVHKFDPSGSGEEFTMDVEEGTDVTEFLGIQKWEAPIPAQLAGDVEGPFPTEIPKTDQTRIQNLVEELKEWQDNPKFIFECTEKLDGSSMTVFVIGDRAGVCSRNWALKETEGNTLWRVARREGLIDKIRSTGRNLALQGEIIGEGIQGNKYGISGQDFRLFDIYDIDRGEYMTPFERRVFAETHGIAHVPVFSQGMIIQEFVRGLLDMAEGKSVLNAKAEREGLVFKCNTFGGPSFKAISNKFLLKGGE
jgi:RNA ligase (TIGR02306 family)